MRLKTKARHQFISVAYSIDGPGPNADLIKAFTQSLEIAWAERVDTTQADTSAEDFQHFNTFPGEHYRLLRGFAKYLAPKLAVEIGTYTGMGSLALMQGLTGEAKLHTFDIREWKSLPTHLKQANFDSGKIIQHVSDLSDRSCFAKHQELLDRAELIFCDGPKDGRFEYVFLDYLQQLKPSAHFKLLILDDIRFPNMIDLWRSIDSPKLDISSLGHFSGTGLVDIRDGLKLRPLGH